LNAEGVVVALEHVVSLYLPLVDDVLKSGITERADALRLALTNEAMPDISNPAYSSIGVRKDQLIRVATSRCGRQVATWADDMLRKGILNEAYHTQWSLKEVWISEVLGFIQGFREEIPNPLRAA